MIPTIEPDRAKSSIKRLWEDQRRRERGREESEELGASFRKFVPKAWAEIEPSKPFISNCWHIDAICEHMQAVADGQIRNLIINVPPGSAKSNLVSVMYPAWKWIKDPEWRSIYASNEAALSTRDSVRCRELLDSLWYKETFQPTWTFSTRQDEKTYYANSAKGWRMSTSVGGRGTGHRASLVAVDDPLRADAQYSDADLEACIRWWENVMYNRLIDLQKDARVIIMQRISDLDLSGHLLRQGGWDHLMVPMRYDPVRSKVTVIGWKDPRTTLGELMFEPIFSEEEVKKLEAKELWAGQYQQQPNVEGGGILKSHRWNYWQPAGLNLPPVRVKMPNGTFEDRVAVDLPDTFDLMLQSWDCSVKDLKTSDYVCGQVHGVRGAQRFILDQNMKRMGIVDTMAAVREMTGRFPRAHLKLVEDKANGTAVVEMLQREVSGLVLVNPEGGKVVRAQAASPELEAGNWHLPHPMIAPWVGNPSNPAEGGFLGDAVLFPFGAHDDDIDAWSQGAIRIQKEKIGGLFGVSEMDLRVDPFDLALIAKWPRVYGLSITYLEVGAVWLTRKPETDQHFLYAEYAAPHGDPAMHAAAVRKMGEEWLGLMTAQETGRDLKDGYALIRLYEKLGLRIESMLNNEDAAISELAEALRSGKLKVFGDLGSWFNQYRSYRRDDRGNLPERNASLMKATLVAWRGRDRMRAPVDPNAKPKERFYGNVPGHGWMQS